MACLALTGCATDRDGDFRRFHNGLPELPLPLELRCGYIGDLAPGNGFAPEGYGVAGRIAGPPGFSIVLYQSEGEAANPVLYSYDTTGQLIDSMALHFHPCIVSTRLEHASTAVISGNLTIRMTDSTSHFSYMKHGFEYIRNLDSVSVRQRAARINITGRMVVSGP